LSGILLSWERSNRDGTSFRQVNGTHVGIFEVRVPGIDDEIAFIQVRNQILDNRIHGSAGWHKHHDCARPTEQRDELPDVRRTASIEMLRFLAQGSDLCRVFIIPRHGKVVVGHVQEEVAPHDPQTDHAYFTLFL
jgi:hypothetical protein